MKLGAWLNKLAPDFLATGRRFPLAIALAAAATATLLAEVNFFNGWDEHALWLRAITGLATGAVCAVAGVFFRESRPEDQVAGLLLAYVAPLVAAGLFLVQSVELVVPWLLPAVSVLWLSVSPFTRVARGEERQAQQDRFWWVNHQAVATAAIAGVAFLIVLLGFYSIARSLEILFGLNINDLLMDWVLPIVGVFLTPVYWLSTLPKVADYSERPLPEPDFTARAVAFLGQFVLVPLLLIYSLILLAYAVQIIVTQQLPSGTIGWMVLTFVVTGAAAWLVLHPSFVRDRLLVRLFCQWWFWLTLPPLVLFFVAVWVRLDAYGFTPERVLVTAGGVWASVLAVFYLVGRGDIRLMPALAGGTLLLLSVGPWNYTNLPISQQLMRLDALLMAPGEGGASFPPSWDTAQQERARELISYLYYEDAGRDRLVQLLGSYGLDKRWADPEGVMVALGYPSSRQYRPSFVSTRDQSGLVDVSATPLLVGNVYVYTAAFGAYLNLPMSNGWSGAVRFNLSGATLEVMDGAEVVSRIDITPLTTNETATIAQPTLDFAVHGTAMRLVLDRVEINGGVMGSMPEISSIQGTLFSSAPTPSP